MKCVNIRIIALSCKCFFFFSILFTVMSIMRSLMSSLLIQLFINSLIFFLIQAPTWEGRVGAALGTGTGVPGKQAHEKDKEDGEWDHFKTADIRAGKKGKTWLYCSRKKDNQLLVTAKQLWFSECWFHVLTLILYYSCLVEHAHIIYNGSWMRMCDDYVRLLCIDGGVFVKMTQCSLR